MQTSNETNVFKHLDLELSPDLKTKNKDGNRYYVTPDGDLYPSVTTITSQLSKDAIKAWRKRVGAEEANKISRQSSARGTKVHKLCEDYINNDEIDYSKVMPDEHFMFKQIRPELDANLEGVYGCELALYSDFLKVAGRVDCVGIWNGKASIIDFKTSKKAKRHDWITNYFMQEAAYAVMFEERYKIPVSQLVTLIAVEQSEHQIFIEKRDDWIHDFQKLRGIWTPSS